MAEVREVRRGVVIETYEGLLTRYSALESSIGETGLEAPVKRILRFWDL